MDERLSKKIKALGFFLIVMVTYIHSTNNAVRFSFGGTVYDNSLINSMMTAFIGGGMCATAVPLFFVISGYLFFYNFSPSQGAFRDKFKRRFFTLIIPYLSWSLLGLVVFFVLQSVPFSKRFFTHTPVKDLSLQQIVDTIFINPIPYQFWFLRNLILYTLLTPAVYWVLRRISALSMFLIIAVAFVFGSRLRGNDFLFYLFFYMCGCFISIKKIRIDACPGMHASVALLLLWMALLTARTWLNIAYGSSIFALNNAALIFGIIALWCNYDFLFAWIEKEHFFWVTSFTFFIFAAHEPLMTIYKKALTYYLKNFSHISVLLYLIVPLLAVATLLILGRFFKKRFRNTYDFLVGSRG